MVCKLLHYEYRASEGANYQNMPLQCIVFSGLACSQHAIKLILVSDEADLRVDSNDSSPMCISCKTKKLFKLLLGSSQHEQSIVYCNIYTSNIVPCQDWKCTPFLCDFCDVNNKFK